MQTVSAQSILDPREEFYLLPIGWRTQREVPAKTIIGRAKALAWIEEEIKNDKANYLRQVKPTEGQPNYDTLIANYERNLIEGACAGKTPLLKPYTWRLIGTFNEKAVISEALRRELRIDGRRTQLQLSDWDAMIAACIKARGLAKDGTTTDYSAELLRMEHGRKFLGRIDELERLGLDIDDLMKEADANGLMEHFEEVSLVDAIKDQVDYEKALIANMEFSQATADKHSAYYHRWLEYWSGKNRGSMTYRMAMSKSNFSEWVMGKDDDGEFRFTENTRQEARGATCAIAKRLILEGGKSYSQEMLDRVFKIPKHQTNRDKTISKVERRFRDAYVQGDHELRAGLNESWDNSEVAARYIFEHLGGLRPEEIGHPGCPNHPKLGFVPPFSYDVDTGEVRVNELGKTGTRTFILFPNARFLLGILAAQGRLILKPLVDYSKAPQKGAVMNHKNRPLTGRYAQRSQMTALRGRSGYLNSHYRQGCRYMKPILKTRGTIRSRNIGIPGGTRHPIDKEWERQVSEIMEKARNTNRTFVMIPFGRFIVKSGRHSTGTIVVNASGGNLTLASVILGHTVPMFLKHYLGRLNLTIWSHKLPQSKGYTPPGTDAFGKPWKETWTGGSNPVYRACKAMLQALPRQVRAMRRIRTVDGALLSAPLLDADGNVQYIPILDKDGKQLLNNKGAPAFELIRERDIPLPDFFTINSGGNAPELLSQRKAFEAYSAQDAVRRDALANLNVDTLRAEANANKNVEVPESVLGRVRSVVTSNPQLKTSDLATRDEFKGVEPGAIASAISWLRRRGIIPRPPKQIPLRERINDILIKNPRITHKELIAMSECSGYTLSTVEFTLGLCRKRAREQTGH